MDPSRSRIAQLARIPLYARSIEKLFSRLTRSSSPDSLIARIPPKHIDYPKPSIRDSEVNGIKYLLDISDFLEWYVYWGFVDASRRRLYSLIAPGDTLVDVGANLGEVALNFARLAGPAGRVYAFEPFPGNYAKLRANCKLNSFDTLEIFNKGLGTISQTASMVAEAGNAGMNRVMPLDPNRNSDAVVEIIRLDDFARDISLSKIDLIKIDVEGYEMNVLSGAIETLKRLRPKLFVEIIDTLLQQQDSSAFQVFELLESLGYEIFIADTNEAVTSKNVPRRFQYDIVAMPAEHVRSPSVSTA